MRILIVEDEPELLHQLHRIFVDQKYEVDTAEDGESALDKVFGSQYDLILLDVMLPHIDGMQVLREIRQDKIPTPVLMLTAKSDVSDKIRGLDEGADDYLAKPFSIPELLARVRALLRRFNDPGRPVLDIKDVRLNTITREVTRQGQSVTLTPKEFSILEFLLYNKNRAVSRVSLTEHVWGEDFDPYTMSNFIEVHIKNLRHKISDAGEDVIRTLRGFGYIIRDDRP